MSEAQQIKSTIQPVSMELAFELEQTLYREARLLDSERYEDWVEMLASDIHYFMPVIEGRYRKDKTDMAGDLKRMAYYNDNMADLKQRLARIKTGTAWSEDPATRFTHLITNVEVETTEKEGEYKVYSNFVTYRNSKERDQDVQQGNREDIWRRTENGFQLVKRLIILKQNVLMSKNMNIYF